MPFFANFEIENSLINKGYSTIVGIDEVGRGAAFSSVVAAAAIVPPNQVSKLLGKVRDSKKISFKKREELYDLIMDTCVVAFDGVDNKVIDEINILNATKRAMSGALFKLVATVPKIDFVLVDGPVIINSYGIEQQQIIDGDTLCVSIAAASIIAKVVRDNIVMSLHNIYPDYGLDRNKGYLTKDHILALRKHGPTDLHRLSFNKVLNDDKYK